MAPIHPVTQTNRLFCLAFCKSEDSLFTPLYKLINAVGFDIALRLHAEFLLDFYLNPQTLAVEAILIALLISLHGF